MKSLLHIFIFFVAAVVAQTQHKLYDQSNPETASTGHRSLPIVTLPYERHQAIFDEERDYYSFSNIPYAQPPTGERRFASPEAITTKSDVLNDGTVGYICPQSRPIWIPSAVLFLVAWTVGLLDQGIANHPKLSGVFADENDYKKSEDCLFLDVVVPKSVWEKKESDKSSPAPVMIWIHGGGFVNGHKNEFGRPTGLFNASNYKDGEEEPHSDGMIYVTINYRLGAFGWLSSPDFISEGGAPNVGLLDQRAAFEWVQKYISLFNGDPDRVTVVGASAGAASVVHHLTSYGGGKLGGSNVRKHNPPAFQRAILQSTGFFPHTVAERKNIYSTLLKLTHSLDLDQLRLAPIWVLEWANSFMIQTATYGHFTFGPAVDNGFVPAPPGLLLDQGYFWPDIKILIGDESNEGLIFTPPLVRSDAQLRKLMIDQFSDLQQEELDEVIRMYPIGKGFTKKQKVQRAADALGEPILMCNTLFVLQSYPGSYQYNFGISSGYHGQDGYYTYFEPPYVNHQEGLGNFTQVTAGTEAVAKSWQGYLTSFVMYGDPNVVGLGPRWYPAESIRGVVNITSTRGPGGYLDPIGSIEFSSEENSERKKRCDWWRHRASLDSGVGGQAS